MTLTSGFDAVGNRTSLTDNLAGVGRTTYSYDLAERLTTIARSLGGSDGPQVVYGFDAGNRLTSESRQIGSSATATEVNTTFSYDNANRLTTITDGSSVYNFFPPGWILTPLATYTYGYDNANRVTSEQNAEGTVTYGYDAANELTGASGSRAETYTYDSGGNRTMAGYTTGTGNELTASPGATYTYDNEGNMTAQANTSSHVVTSYTYDFHNRLTGVTVGGTATATYTYDPLDRRIGFKDNGTQTWVVWDGQNPYADFNGAGTLQERYLYGPAIDALLARTDSGGTTAWYLTDRIGTVRDIVNTSGTVIDHLSYDSFGNVLTESNSGNGDRFKFTGREYDATTGQYYYRARYYGSSVGRFISQDPTGLASGDVNFYRYVNNSPTCLVDPTGTLADAGVISLPASTAIAVYGATFLEGIAFAAAGSAAIAGGLVIVGYETRLIYDALLDKMAAEASSALIASQILMVQATLLMKAMTPIMIVHAEKFEEAQRALDRSNVLLMRATSLIANPPPPKTPKWDKWDELTKQMLEKAEEYSDKAKQLFKDIIGSN